MPKGHTNNPNGRPKGSENKVTSDTRAFFRKLLERRHPKIEKMLDQIIDEDPKEALKIIMSLTEYCVPKLARTEIQNLDKDGKPSDSAPATVIIRHVKSNIEKD